MKQPHFAIRVAAFALLAGSAASVFAAPSRAGGPQDAPELFQPLTAGVQAAGGAGASSEGANFVGALRTDLLLDSATTALGVALPGGGHASLVRVSSETSWGGGQVWSGRVVDDPLGSAMISLIGDVAVGSIRAEGRLFTLEFHGAGLHRIRSVDESAMPGCGVEASHAVANAIEATPSSPIPNSQSAPQFATGGAPATVDVLVMYTTEAKNADGGTAAIEARINLAVAETNQAYANSQVLQRLRLVHQAEAVGYVEDPSFSTMLGQLRSTSDSVIDNVHALRDQYGADMVAMIVAGGQYCGIGYLMSSPGASFESNAFSVTARTCATGYYSFGHELGHNMGCHHDRDNASSGAYPYSYGFRTANGSWRTIMAYAPGTRIQYFSNPNVSYSGQVLGIADPAPDSAENWKSLNNTAAIVAQFRCAQPIAYGVSKLTSAATSPVLSHVGSPSISAGNLQIRIAQALPNKSAIAFYGFAQGSAPWNGGTLYISGQVLRLGVHQLDGSGAANFAFPVANCTPGDVVYCQGWFRDPAAPDGTTVGLTHGLRIDVCP